MTALLDLSRLDSLLARTDACIHLVGCGGAGMRALAELARDLGWQVSGSDGGASPRTIEKLAASGVDVRRGHAAAHVPRGAQLVVHSPAVPPENIEREAALQRGVPDVSYPEMLGAVAKRWPTIAVAGTHGKSTTTALIGSVLTDSGAAAAVLCGAEVLSRGRHGWSGPGRFAVVEACEYRRHFLEIEPEIGVVLGIEPDHFDCFPTLDVAIDAYRRFLEGTKSGGLALVNIDGDATRKALEQADCFCRVETLSTSGKADWTIEDIHDADPLTLTVRYGGQVEERLETRLSGKHHAANVLAAYAACRAAGADRDAIRRTLASFQGLARRLEPFPAWRGVERFDDYAHHPTAVSAVLSTLRQQIRRRGTTGRKRRLVCAFQPHQVSRTERLAAEFGSALSLADLAYVLPVYAAREGSGAITEELSLRVVHFTTSPCRASFIPSLDHALTTLETALRPGDMFVTLGAGDIDCLQYELPRRFP